MSVGERADRLELERRESLGAQKAWMAYELVQQTVDDGGADAIGLILALLHAAPGAEEAAVAVGSGPLEDLINDHGDELVEVVEQTARRASEFAKALGSVVVEQGTLRPETVDRLARWLPAN